MGDQVYETIHFKDEETRWNITPDYHGVTHRQYRNKFVASKLSKTLKSETYLYIKFVQPVEHFLFTVSALTSQTQLKIQENLVEISRNVYPRQI